MKQQTFQVQEEVPFRRGYLVVYNRALEESPILQYKSKSGRTIWARELEVKTRKKFKEQQLNEISNLKVKPGLLRDEVHFSATWSYGKDEGRAYIWKFNRFHRFYLSW